MKQENSPVRERIPKQKQWEGRQLEELLRGFEYYHSKRSLVKGYRASRKGMWRFSQPCKWDGVLRRKKLMIEQSQQSAIGTSVLTMTPAAADKVLELLKQENDPSLGLRVFVAGGGCSGLQYGMTLDEEQEGDTVVYVKVQDDGTIAYITNQEGEAA